MNQQKKTAKTKYKVRYKKVFMVQDKTHKEREHERKLQDEL